MLLPTLSRGTSHDRRGEAMTTLLGHLAAAYTLRCAVRDVSRMRRWRRYLKRLYDSPQNITLTLPPATWESREA